MGHAHRILDWHENSLTPEEVPPQWMWPFDDLLDQWFEDVNEARTRGEKYEADEPTHLVRNELLVG